MKLMYYKSSLDGAAKVRWSDGGNYVATFANHEEAKEFVESLNSLREGMRKINMHLGLPADAGWAHAVNAIEGLKNETAA